jgi:F0F1-type ATP synthase assembly protein I
VHDPIAASRRAVARAVATQAVVVGVVALACLAKGPQTALAALLGGAAMVAGNAVVARMALGGVVPARTAFARLLLGTVAKWLVAILVLAVGLGVWRLPPLPMLYGLAAGLLAYLLALNLGNVANRNRVDRER